MAEDCTDGAYFGVYSRFFSEFVARVNPYDQLPVSVSSKNVTEAEIIGEITNVTLQYLNQMQCPASLQAHLVHQVIQEIKFMCKKQPEDCGFKVQEKTYTSLKLMQAITGKVNEICTRYLDNSALVLLPPPPPTPFPQIAAGGTKNGRRKMEDRYVVLHDLHTMFGIQHDSTANYYAVFDGHAGQDAAVYCATHLHQYLAESVYYPTDPERALRDAFITTDARFVEKSKTQKICGGTTAVCALILNKKLYVAWAGDSTATLIKRDSFVQLVNPHRLHREDEVQRIGKMGGVVMKSMGIMRVNGMLGVSRAIGDVQYKPFVTGEPEIKSVLLDGTEDFLVLATDGLTDYVQATEILTILYHEIRRDPDGFKRVHQVLLQLAKHAGSTDNITVIVVLLTPASEIAARPQNAYPYQRLQVNDIYEKMNSKVFLDLDDARNAINSNILKQTMISQESRDDDDGILASSNGKHENGDGDYDYSDLGPETDVDAIDDVATVPVKNLSYEFYKDDEQESHRDSNILDNVDVDEKVNANETHKPISDNNFHEDDDDDDEDEDEDDDENENENERENNVGLDEILPPKVVQDRLSESVQDEGNNIIHKSLEEKMDDETEVKQKDETDEARDVVDDAGPTDYDDLPASPQAYKPLQHALINEADNVADSEDSEDEWNYYRVDPNKEKDSATPIDESEKPRNEEKTEIPEDPVEDTQSKIQSEAVKEEIKCENPKEDLSELINTEISAEGRAVELEEEEKNPCAEEQENLKDMDFQLNPDAAEFVPVSPQFIATRMNLVDDFPVSGSPFKQVPQMDDIQLPSQSEFEKEVCQRPSEVNNEGKEYQNGDHVQRTDYTDFTSDRQKVPMAGNLDDSEISSTKAEFGDESSVSFLTASEFQGTGGCAIEESFSSSERDYDIAKDPMAMSFTPSDFQAAFDKGVDLNAVHNLSGSDLDDKNGSMEDEDFARLSPDLKPESAEAEDPTDKPEHAEEQSELANLTTQQEDNEDTFIEHAEASKASIGDFLNLKSESSLVEQQETARYDHSPLTENYSGEFESEKEPISVDNEQLLSPCSADIEETKPIDEASEEAALSEHELQKEACPNEANTLTSLSPVPDTMESDLIAPVEKAEDQSSVQAQFLLHTDATEFKPNLYTSSEVSQLAPAEVADVCKPSSPMESKCPYQPFAVETSEKSESIQQNLTENLLFDEKEVEEPICAKAAPLVQASLLDFTEEQNASMKPSLIQSELTPPLSAEEIKPSIPQAVDDLTCPFKSSFTTETKPEEIIESKECPEVTSVVENKEEEIMDAMADTVVSKKPTDVTETSEQADIAQVKERSLNLSESMQEFTGLESQLEPKEEMTPQPVVVAQIHEEVQKEEVQEVVDSEKLLHSVVDEEKRKIEKEDEVQEVPEKVKEVKEVPEKVEEPEVKESDILKLNATDSQVKETEVKEAQAAEPVPAIPEKKVAVAAAVAVAATAVAAGAATSQSKTKAKATTAKSAKPAPKSASTTKSTPTSPSKMVTSTTKSIAATKKSSPCAPSRPKDLDAPKKSTISSTTISRLSAAKATSSTATKTASRTNTGVVSKSKPTTVAATKSPVADKKPTTNGDVKSLSKPAAAKPLSKAAPATKTTLVKTSTTRTTAGSTTTTTAKPRPSSATTASKSSATSKSSVITSTTSSTAANARPKTAPVGGNATKPRTLASRAPMIDKQVKETANKQISMGRTSTTTTKATRLSSVNSTTSTTVKRLSSTTKTTTTTSPTKKSITGSKVSGKTSIGGKATTEKEKVVQNGVSEKVEVNAIIEDVPRKDLSPVVPQNDNQLIMSSD